MKNTLLIELLTEELPPKALDRLGRSFAADVFSVLREAEFAGQDSVCTPFATPRRLAMSITNVLAQQKDRIIERKGPAVSSGLDAEGKETKALEGFMRSAGVTFEQLRRISDGKVEYFAVQMEQKGKLLQACLSEIVGQALKKLPVPKLMRWGNSDHQFVRPVHGLIMLHGPDVVGGEILGLKSGRLTKGHRFLCPDEFISIPDAENYEEILSAKGKVIASIPKRREKIDGQLKAKAKELRADINPSEGLLDEVTALVEWPAVYVGEFEKDFLEVPQECLILTMQQNQKYFPLLDADQKLLNQFLIVSNMEVKDPRHIIGGNQRVVRPRLSDARFFYNQDRKESLESRVAKLGSVVYHNKLGSQLQRVERLTTLAGAIAHRLNADKANAELAARLCKADLMTDMVGEFPELQGVMGRYYALHDGEENVVADAIESHYRPRFAGDALPEGDIALSVALADKLEALAGFFGIGQTPTGDKDPFGLRRHALGVIRMLIETPLPLRLDDLMNDAFGAFPSGLIGDAHTDLETFIFDRLRGYLKDSGYSAGEVESVVSMRPVRLDLLPRQLDAVRVFSELPEAESLAAANKRVANILRQAEAKGESFASAEEGMLKEPAETALFLALKDVSPKAGRFFEEGNYAEYLRAFAALKNPVDKFFDEVMVMVDDAVLRHNRLALLRDLREAMNKVADISRLAQ